MILTQYYTLSLSLSTPRSSLIYYLNHIDVDDAN